MGIHFDEWAKESISYILHLSIVNMFFNFQWGNTLLMMIALKIWNVWMNWIELWDKLLELY